MSMSRSLSSSRLPHAFAKASSTTVAAPRSAFTLSCRNHSAAWISLSHQRLPRLCSSFSTSSTARVSPTSPLRRPEDMPLLKNPSPEAVYNLFIARAALCTDERSSRVLLGDEPTQKVYYDQIMHNMQFVFYYLNTVDLKEFKTADVPSDSRIGRARVALFQYARTTHRWLHAAIELGSAPEHAKELKQALFALRSTMSVIQAYEEGTEGISYAGVFEEIFSTFFFIIDVVTNAAGGGPKDFIVYEESEG